MDLSHINIRLRWYHPPPPRPMELGHNNNVRFNEWCVVCANIADVLLDGVWEVEEEPVALEDGEGTTRLVRTRLAAEDVSKQLLT